MLSAKKDSKEGANKSNQIPSTQAEKENPNFDQYLSYKTSVISIIFNYLIVDMMTLSHDV